MSPNSFTCCRAEGHCATHCGNWQQCPSPKALEKEEAAIKALQAERLRTVLIWQSTMIGTALTMGLQPQEILAALTPERVAATIRAVLELKVAPHPNQEKEK